MYKVGRANVRIHGSVSREQLEAATEKFIRGVDNQKRKEANEKSAAADGAMEARPQSVACG